MGTENEELENLSSGLGQSFFAFQFCGKRNHTGDLRGVIGHNLADLRENFMSEDYTCVDNPLCLEDLLAITARPNLIARGEILAQGLALLDAVSATSRAGELGGHFRKPTLDWLNRACYVVAYTALRRAGISHAQLNSSANAEIKRLRRELNRGCRNGQSRTIKSRIVLDAYEDGLKAIDACKGDPEKLIALAAGALVAIQVSGAATI